MEQEKCPYFNCALCHWGVCTGNKKLWVELKNCKKEYVRSEEQ